MSSEARIRMLDLAEALPGAAALRQRSYDLLPADASVVGYRAEKVFHELADPARALAEAARVLAPDGVAVLLGQDWDTFVIDADDRSLTRRIVHARADAVTEPWSARRYRNLLLAAGFDDPTVEVHTAVVTDPVLLPVLLGLAAAAHAAGAISTTEADAWTGEQRARARDGRLFLAIPMFLAAAQKG